jgi:hypothetical protein
LAGNELFFRASTDSLFRQFIQDRIVCKVNIIFNTNYLWVMSACLPTLSQLNCIGTS